MRRRMPAALLGVASALGLVAFGNLPEAAAETVTVHAAPNGSGTECSAAAPCDLVGARNRVRALLPSASGDITVDLRGGTYRMTKGLELTPQDSGQNGAKVIWQARAGERPVFSGARKVEGWQLDDADKKIYKAAVPAGTESRQLYVDGNRAVRARSALNPPGFTKTATGFTSTDPKYATWGNPTGIELVGRNAWKHLRCPLSAVTAEGGGSKLTAATPCWNNGGTAPNPEYYFPYNGSGKPGLDRVTWIENARELLDEPGEFYLDSAAGSLYYIPRAGEDLATADVELPVAENLVSLTGTPGRLTPVNNDDSRVTYAGAWSTYSGRPYGNLRDDVRATATNGDSATIKFTGTGIDVLSERSADGGDIDVYVDGKLDKTVSAHTTGKRLVQQVVYSRTGLGAGEHTVKLVKKSGGYLVVDGFVPVTAPIEPVHDIALRGITFAYATWLHPSGPDGYADNQAGVIWTGSPARTSRTPGAVRVERGKNIEVSGGEFAHLGGVGADLAFGTQDSRVVGNRIHDISGSGVSVGEFDDFWLTDTARMTSGNSVSHNAISYVGQEYEDAVGILVGFTRDVSLDHNDIGHTPYSGISLGWGWGWASEGPQRHGTNYARGNKIQNNHVHDVMRTLNDGGHIYTLGGQGDGSTRSLFSGNVLNNATGDHAEAQGIYLDEGSSWWDAYDNVVSQTGNNWTQEWISTIHDITIRDNFTDVTRQLNNGTNVTITNTTFVTDGNWPAKAKEIVAAAGPGPQHARVAAPEAHLGNDGELGPLLAPVTIKYEGAGWGVSAKRTFRDLSADVHYTKANDDKVTFTFTGTGLRVLGERGPDQGEVAVTVDGEPAGTVNTFADSRKVQQVIKHVRDLPHGKHTVTLTKKSGEYLTIDGYLADRTLDNTDTGLTYEGTWKRDGGRGYGDFQDDVHYAEKDGDSVTATFSGTGIDVVTEKYKDEGKVDVYVDGRKRTTLDLANDTRLTQQKVYSIDGLPAGVHTLKLVKQGGQYLVVDRFTVR